MLEELPAGRGTEGRDGEVGAQDDAGRRVGGSGAGCVSHVMTCVFILRAMENHRKVLNKKEIGSTLILTPASRHSRSGAGHTFDRWGTWSQRDGVNHQKRLGRGPTGWVSLNKPLDPSGPPLPYV